MSKFFSYISEGRSKPIENTKWLTNALTKDFNKALRGNPIFRGIKDQHSPIFYADPQKSAPRKSANTFNYYTLLIDHILPQWSNFPKRSKSFICSNDYYGADGYGTTYIILPKNGSKIAVCPSNDIWTGFIKRAGESLWSINHVFRSMGLNYDNWKTFKAELKAITIEGFEYHISSKHELFYDSIKSKLGKFNTLYELIEWIFDPKENGFFIINPGGKTPHTRVEVWTEGPVIGVRVDSPGDYNDLYDFVWNKVEEL